MKSRLTALMAFLTLLVPPVAVTAQTGHSNSSADYPECQHPYPCGDEWPVGLEGPFALKEVREVRIPMDDGIEMHGWVGLPAVPDGVRVPVALHSSPYLSWCSVEGEPFCAGGPEDAAWWRDPPGQTGTPPFVDAVLAWGVSPIEIVKRGIATAFVSVRGTGNSGGCLDMWGPREITDQARIVEWFAAQPWSNGRSAMGGLSYPGTTPLMAAVQTPPALKTIVVAGIISDVYLFLATPQGAKIGSSSAFTVGRSTSISIIPPLGSGPRHGIVEHAPVLPERLCPELVELMSKDATDLLTDRRHREYYEERRLIDRFPNVTASALVAHGLRDDTGHAFQDNELWRTMINAPKRLIEGQWGHTFPTSGEGTLSGAWETDRWDELVLDWLDFWLWGKGPVPEQLDTVGYQDHLGTWRESTAWPPAEAHDEVLYLGGDAVRVEPGGASRSLRSAPNILNSYRGANAQGLPYTPWDAFCPNPVTGAGGLSGLVYVSEPITESVTIAGNPHAYLRLQSDLPGGIVTVKLVDLAPDFSCNPAGQPSGIRYLAGGGADLRFHDGTFEGHDFPTGTPTNVRIDIFDLAETLQPGHRLAIEVSYGESHIEWMGQPYLSRMTVRADGGAEASHAVLPIVEGTLGGATTTLTYPPRPFLPPLFEE